MPEILAKSNYLGSKRRLAKYIAEKLPAEGRTIFDPMAGVSAVLVEAARRNYRVRGNDLSVVPYWYSKGVFEGAALADGDVEKLAGATPVDGWLASEWEGKYPRPKDVRRYLDGLAKLAREWKGAKGWAAKAVASAVLQTVYSESGSGYSTLRYESVAKIADTVRRAAREVNGLVAEVGGRGTITTLDARTMAIPKSDVVYFDPPYFKRDKGAVHYFQSYRVPNSILLGRAWREENLKPEDIPAIVERLCRAAGHVFVSTSSNEVVPYARELARHKRSTKRFRVKYRQTSGFGSRDEEQRQNLFVAKAESAGTPQSAPPEDGTYRYVIQEHFRGRTVHADLRMETGGKTLEAWTIQTQVAGAINEPVTTVEAAREASGHSRVDWEAARADGPVAARPKVPCAPSWLGFEGVVEPGETGALEDAPGVVAIVDRGVCEYGARREGLREYFLSSDNADGRIGRVVFTRLEGAEAGKGPDVWLFGMPEDATPHVLSPRAVRDRWIPPAGVSALPAAVREEVPEERRYWDVEDDAARLAARDALAAALAAGELELGAVEKNAIGSEIEKRKLVPFNQWGSSAKYAKRLAAKLPDHERYVEPFCGAAAVFFAKERTPEEILADADAEVVFALKYLQRLTPQKFEALKRFDWRVSRAGFKRARETKPSSDAERFWKLVYGRLCSWGGIPNGRGYSTIHDGQTYKLDDLWRFHERLKGAMVARQDWQETIRKADSAGTLFFVDPPYVEEWGAGGGIPPEEIAEAVKGLKGQFVVAYTDSARARRALSKVGKLFTMRLLEDGFRHAGRGRRREVPRPRPAGRLRVRHRHREGLRGRGPLDSRGVRRDVGLRPAGGHHLRAGDQGVGEGPHRELHRPPQPQPRRGHRAGARLEGPRGRSLP
jgi:DNA adenine methylase